MSHLRLSSLLHDLYFFVEAQVASSRMSHFCVRFFCDRPIDFKLRVRTFLFPDEFGEFCVFLVFLVSERFSVVVVSGLKLAAGKSDVHCIAPVCFYSCFVDDVLC